MTQGQNLSLGVYILKNVATGTVLDLRGGSADEKTPVTGYELHGGDNQKWQLEGTNPFMTLRNVRSGTFLSFENDTSAGKAVGSVKPHYWSVHEADEGYAVEPTNCRGYVLDITGSNPTNETPAIIYPNYATNNQKWIFMPSSSPIDISQDGVHKNISIDAPNQFSGEGVASPRPSRVNPHKGLAHIVAGNPHQIVSKYVFQWSWVEPMSGIPIPLTFNINSDVGVPSFRSIGAPENKALQVEYDRALGQPHGFCSFNGTIGHGRIYIEVPAWTIEISGQIEGGPTLGRTFTGNGGWYTG